MILIHGDNKHYSHMWNQRGILKRGINKEYKHVASTSNINTCMVSCGINKQYQQVHCIMLYSNTCNVSYGINKQHQHGHGIMWLLVVSTSNINTVMVSCGINKQYQHVVSRSDSKFYGRLFTQIVTGNEAHNTVPAIQPKTPAM